MKIRAILRWLWSSDAISRRLDGCRNCRMELFCYTVGSFVVLTSINTIIMGRLS